MPSTATDRINGVMSSVAVKAPVKAVSTGSLALAGLQTVGGVALAEGDRVLVAAQTNAVENGIYVASALNWQRAKDFSGARDVVQGTLIVANFDNGEGLLYRVVTADPIRIGTSNIVITPVVEPNQIYPQTQAEIDAGVTPIYLGYQAGDFKRYGAVGDGVTDDGPAVQAAMAQSLQGGATPFGHPGETYLCTTWTAISTAVSMRLNGNGCTIKGPATYGDFCRPGGSVRFTDTKFVRWSSVCERTAADGGQIDGFQFTRCEVTDFDSLPINIECPIASYWIEDSYFHDGTCGDVIRIGRNVQADQINWRAGHIVNNTIRDIEIDTSTEGGALLIYGYDADIIGNKIYDINNDGVKECWGIYTKCVHANIEGNTIRNITTPGSAWGINVKGEVRSEIGTPQGYGTRVRGNTITGVVGTANDGYGIRIQTDSVIAAENTIEDAGGTGISVDYSEPTVFGNAGVQVSHNHIRFATAGSSVAVRVSTCLSDVMVDHNIIEGASVGARLSGINGGESDWAILHNTLNVASQGVLIRRDANLTNLLIEGNTVKGSSPPSTGIRFETGSATMTNVRVLDNDLQGATTQISGTLPKFMQLRHRWRYQTTAAGPSTALALDLPDEAAYLLELKALAMLDTGGEVGAYKRFASFYRDGGGNATVVDSVESEVTKEVTSAWEATMDGSGTSVRVRLTGEASHNINWALTLEMEGVGA